MAELSDKYKGVELFGGDGEKIGTVAGLLVDDYRQQFYVVERGGLLGIGGSQYYVPADLGVATGSQRLDVEATEAEFVDLGWDRSPAEAEPAGD